MLFYCQVAGYICLLVVDKLLETNESMHRLMQEKHQLIGRLMKLPDDDFDSIAEVRHADHLLLCIISSMLFIAV